MLSLAMIVKDEALTIERTINIVRPYVDEVVIGIDRASSDGTREILQALDVKLLDIDLTEELEKSEPIEGGDGDWGFSRARNKVLDACLSLNWRLILDGHETVLKPESMSGAIQTAVASGCDAVECFMDFELDAKGIPITSFASVRILHPSVRYKNPIHNIPVSNKTHRDFSIVVQHWKQDQAPAAREARNVQRAAANVQGFKKQLSKNANDPRSWFYLATAYKESGKYSEAIEAYEECLKYSKFREERWQARVNLGTCHSFLKDDVLAREQFVLAIGEYPAMAEAYYYLGDLAYKQKRYHEAQVWLEKSLELAIPECKLFVDRKIYLVARYDRLSMVYNHLGQYGKAILLARKALLQGSDKRIEKNVRVWLEHIEKHGSAYYDKLWTKDAPVSAAEKQRLTATVAALGDVRTVLDVGCGPGNIIEFLPKQTMYTGIDVSKVAREKVEARGQRALESLDVLDNNDLFDACVLGEVLEHMVDDKATLFKAASLVRPGGVIVATVPRYAVMRDPAHTRDYTATEFLALMSSVGRAVLLDSIGPWMFCKCIILA